MAKTAEAGVMKEGRIGNNEMQTLYIRFFFQRGLREPPLPLFIRMHAPHADQTRKVLQWSSSGERHPALRGTVFHGLRTESQGWFRGTDGEVNWDLVRWVVSASRLGIVLFALRRLGRLWARWCGDKYGHDPGISCKYGDGYGSRLLRN
jgi:hypothetical protein